MGIIETFIASTALKYAAGSIAAVILAWILKRIPFDRFAKWAEKIGDAQGKAITTFFNAKLPKLWNKLIEPVLIDTIHAIFFAWVRGFIAGLKSDNEPE